MSGDFESKPTPPPQPSRCQQAAPPNKDEYIPAGDYCFHLSTEQTLHLKVGYPAEFGLANLPEARLDVFHPNGKNYPDDTKTLVAGGPDCELPITKPYSRVEITATKGSGIVRIRPKGSTYTDRLSNC